MAKITNRKNQRSDLWNYLERGYRMNAQQPHSDAAWARLAEDEGASVDHLKKWAKIANAFIHCEPGDSPEAGSIIRLHICDEALTKMSYATYTNHDRRRFLDMIDSEQQRLGRLLSQGETYEIIESIKHDKARQIMLIPALSEDKEAAEILWQALKQTLSPSIYDAFMGMARG